MAPIKLRLATLVGFSRPSGLLRSCTLNTARTFAGFLARYAIAPATCTGALAPFIDESGNVSPFHEIRLRSAVPLEHAVWILSTEIQPEDQLPNVPAIDLFRERYGKVARSYWHRAHQMEMLGERQYLKIATDADGWPTEFVFIGEHYWRQRTSETRALKVALPAHPRSLDFTFTSPERAGDLSGPWRFADVARILYATLRRTGGNIDELLPYRLIRSYD